MESFPINLEKETIENPYYRRVIFTSKFQQLVLMSLRSNEDIPKEIHTGDQFIRIEKGSMNVWLNGKCYVLKEGDSVSIPAGVEHYIKNTGVTTLKLYTVYSPPEHSKTLIQSMTNGILTTLSS